MYVPHTFFFTQNDTSYFELRMLKSHQKEVKINASKEDIDYGFPTTPTHTPQKLVSLKIIGKLRKSIVIFLIAINFTWFIDPIHRCSHFLL